MAQPKRPGKAKLSGLGLLIRGVVGIAERGPRVAHDLHGHPSRTVVDDVPGRVLNIVGSGTWSRANSSQCCPGRVHEPG